MAPSLACLFMDKLEQDFLNKETEKPSLWLRYIDDIFMIWEHGRESLNQWLERINNHHPTIKFTHDFSEKEAIFLDTRVKVKNNTLTTNLYTKPTDTSSYLPYASCHPMATKRSLPYSTMLRIERICTEEEDYEENCAKKIAYFKERGYPVKVIEK